MPRKLKSELLRAKDIKGLLRRCHNRLHGQGADTDEEDLTMDMVRILLAKAVDEEEPGELPQFYCTPEELGTDDGCAAVASRVGRLFDKAKALSPQVFSDGERIAVGPRRIANVVAELEGVRLLSAAGEASDWDVMGLAYEEYTATYSKRRKGQFFTNRLVVDFMVAMCDPDATDIVLDPAGGSGGFLTGVMRYVKRKTARQGTHTAEARQPDGQGASLFMVEIGKRLVKIAKVAMILHGEGHAGMTQGDSLGDVARLDPAIVGRCGLGTPTLILTNPPFAGVGEGRVTGERLRHFRTGKGWHVVDGVPQPSGDVLIEGAPPEMLFLERCIDWLAPGGRLGIVLPKSFLDTQTYYPARHMVFASCRIRAVVNCAKDTFAPFTGVRTCILLLEKRRPGEVARGDEEIFMAISRKVGQDSEGEPVFKRDAANEPTEAVDQDLDEILASYRCFVEGKLRPSEFAFRIARHDVDDGLRLNPQAFLPSLNETLRHVASLDGRGGWSVVSLSAVDAGAQIFKGPRLKTEDILAPSPEGDGVESYFTPSAILQENHDGEKWLDVSRASKQQLRAIAAIRVRRGDILVTRSGSIGRVAYVTRRHDGAIVSDDMIRVRIADERARLYVYRFLRSRYAQDQMSRNEYGAVQQHLEPEHLRDVLIPVPEDWSRLEAVIGKTREAIELKERLAEVNGHAERELEAGIGRKTPRPASP